MFLNRLEGWATFLHKEIRETLLFVMVSEVKHLNGFFTDV